MKLKNTHLGLFTLIILLLTGCGQNTGISINTIQGQCPSGPVNAPYCMSVQIVNNGGNNGGQQWITSTNFPISDFTLSVNGATNVLSPATSTATDPNNCAGTNVSPGSSCTFYLQINNEAYSTLTNESININLSYTIKNQLFGAGENQSTSFTVYEITNLYAVNQNGYVNIINGIGNDNNINNNYYYAESNDIIYSSAVDTTSYGFLFLGGGLGIYQVGGESGNESTSPSISPSTFSGIINNLFTQGGNLYASPLGSSSPTIWSYGLSNQTWSTTAAYQLGNTNLVNNANAVSPSGVIYLANSNQVFSCGTATSATSTNCTTEGPSTTAQGSIQAIGFPNGGTTPYTGLFIGTNNGLYAESGTLGNGNTNSWIPVVESGLTTPVPAINTMLSYNGNLYAGDVNGGVWQIESTSTNAISATSVTILPGAITAMCIDTVANVMYLVANNTLYAWVIGSQSPPTNTGITFSSKIVGLNIASQLVSSL